MKIKCRCGKEFQARSPEDIEDHWYYDGWEINDLTSDYALQVFKIHESINELGTGNTGNTFLNEVDNKVRQILKSLLENEK